MNEKAVDEATLGLVAKNTRDKTEGAVTLAISHLEAETRDRVYFGTAFLVIAAADEATEDAILTTMRAVTCQVEDP